MSNKKILFSGIQPTGEIHIGNYLGAIRNWVNLQNKGQYNCIYSIVDLHAITIDYDPREYQNRILDLAATLLACGIDPKKSILFLQSSVKEHAELCWLLNTITPVSELYRMTQFKDKSSKNEKNINIGLLDYPVLMASDILLYGTEIVPVGYDQLQHLELTNIIFRKFNNKFGEFFKKVVQDIVKESKIMSLSNPERKMSKSEPGSYISLSDSPEIIRKKVSRAVTDSIPGKEISIGVQNLLDLLVAFNREDLSKKYQKQYKDKTIKYSELKLELAEVIIKELEPIQKKKQELLKNPKKLKSILDSGAKQAQKIATKNIIEIKKLMGLV